ncbi:MAG TPA: lysophospholipid acyltransferase family protein [Eubacteriales bacterium]|nr:lysophospholipid acyltransferase family protein [Clostridia bacterium]HRR89259.1 lysophospholipid acyltransferase family protein [Eubacteriales bacterium]HRU83899.1 lysophospholipid acyltransferase family protein [Eubacteriales bacterium]
MDNKSNKKQKLPYAKVSSCLSLGITNIAARLAYGARTDKASKKAMKKRKGETFLILCTHSCPIDFMFLSKPIWPRKLSFVVAENMMYTRVLSKFIKKAGAITKKQYYADFACVKRMKQYLDNGINIILCPEGKVTPDGVTGYIAPSVAKLVKWLGYPVAVAVSAGASVAYPKWAVNKMRRNRIVVKMEVAIEKDDLMDMSLEDIYNVIAKKLAHNDYQFQEDNKLVYKGKRFAEGLELIFYRCPKCGAEGSYASKDSHAWCNACGNKIEYRNDGKIVPATEDSVCFPRLDLWTKWEREVLAEEVKAPDFKLSERVDFYQSNDEIMQIVKVGEGVLTLDRENLCFTGDRHGEPFTLNFPLEHLATTVCKCGYSIDLYDEKYTYRFQFKDRLLSQKYSFAVEAIYKMNHPDELNNI